MVQAAGCRASLVIVTYGRDAVLVETVQSVLPAIGADDELIIVDQVPNHRPATAKFLDELRSHPQVRLIELTAPSMTGARNVGTLAAHGPIVIFIDDDVLISRGFVDRHLAYYEDETVAAVAGGIEDRFGRKLSFGSGKYSTKIVGANMSYRRSVLIDLGGFDINLHSTIRDDGDCGERVRRAGWQIANGTACGLVHVAAVSGGAGARIRTDKWYRDSYHNCMYVFLKKPWYQVLIGWPRYLLGTVRHWNPGLSRFLSPGFFFGVFVVGHLQGIRTSRRALPGPFFSASGGGSPTAKGS